MKYKCLICGSVIDRNDICPFCGCDSTKIVEIEEEEPKVYKCLNCGHELNNNHHCPFCGATEEYIFDTTANVAEDDISEEEVSEEPEVEEKTEKPVFEFCEGDECGDCEDYEEEEPCDEEQEDTCCCEDHEEEHECCCGHHEEEHECCCGHHEENECCCGEEDHELINIVDLLAVYGHLYRQDIEKAQKFEKYLRDYFLQLSLNTADSIDFDEAIDRLQDDDYFQDIIEQFK